MNHELTLTDDIASELYSALDALKIWRIEDTLKALRRASGLAGQRKKLAEKEGLNAQANACWIANQYIETWRNYARCWQNLIEDSSDEVWASLQSGRVRIDNLDRLTGANDSRIGWLQKQLRYLDAAFGYNVFMSPEYEVIVAKCSICNQDVRSLDCTHIKGHLYAGEMAYTIIEECSVKSVSLVGNPANRMAVAKIANVAYQYPVLKRIRQELCSPLQSLKVLTPAKLVFGVSGNPGRNSPCPCGSLKKLKYCCLGEWYTTSALFEVTFEAVMTPSFFCTVPM
ncbi:SecC motif-containing protein [Sulfobacillus acidophilus TPY]|uniref:SEC-C motif domain protein n=1 Tax=Sulfobacillus acidophilus (strain ATCC 700253 / DSM 10332 / NAL) TaxID=679936 RepID=G8TZB9_SULAD|nr:SecC motif-containing protein [Sulfobacillus acidophilus TPY]AEW04088.1 SEC-C motif domain protein [Sulfobacillus acidophilus DSM 10332]